MTDPPLTHHEIIRLVEPMVRRGRHVDLAASDRAARVLVFKAVTVESPLPDATPLQETLRLECHAEGRFGLTRVLSHAGGLSATLQASGPQPAALLAWIDAVEAQRHFHVGPGFLLARSWDLELPAQALPPGPLHPSQPLPSDAPGSGTAAARLRLRRGTVQLDGLTLTLALKSGRRWAADIVLTPAADTRLELPEDLLAVLGWDWARLVRRQDGWVSKRRLRGSVARRSHAAERALDQAAGHLAQVLAHPPAAFHSRHWLARWGVVFRRAIPSLTIVFLIAGALSLPRITDDGNAGLWIALQYVPIALLGLSLTLQELPRFEIPPLPRRSKAGRWRPAAPADAALAASAAPALDPPRPLAAGPKRQVSP